MSAIEELLRGFRMGRSPSYAQSVQQQRLIDDKRAYDQQQATSSSDYLKGVFGQRSNIASSANPALNMQPIMQNPQDPTGDWIDNPEFKRAEGWIGGKIDDREMVTALAQGIDADTKKTGLDLVKDLMRNRLATSSAAIPKPTSSQSDFLYGNQDPTFRNYQERMANLRRPSTNVNVNARDREAPIKVTDLKSLTNTQGQHPPFGTLPSQIPGSDYRVTTSSDQKEAQKMDRAGKIVDQLDTMVNDIWVGDDTNTESMFERAKNIGQGNVQQLLQTDPKYKNYQDFSIGTVSQLVKSLGEVGALAEGDVERALALIPKVTGISDSREVAVTKMNMLKELINPAIGQVSGKAPDNRTNTERYSAGEMKLSDLTKDERRQLWLAEKAKRGMK